ncbi:MULTISPECIES: hypothetical protein [Clostridium]|nr:MULTISPECIES: hypothetical protein [Clostridium]
MGLSKAPIVCEKFNLIKYFVRRWKTPEEYTGSTVKIGTFMNY